MHASVRALLDQLIDYAGLFPPAKLPLDQAAPAYLHLKGHSPHRAMLGRFVCPAARLVDLLPLAKAHADAASLQVTALAPQSSSVENFFLQMDAALTAIEEFRRGWGAEQVIEAIEMPLPGAVQLERAADFLGHAAKRLAGANLRGFLEVPPGPDWHSAIKKISLAMSESGLGLKLRCGGVTAEAFPRPEQVALFIACCRKARVPWKATAGLHHPRQHWDPVLNLWHHGFLNVFAAGIFAWSHPMTETELAAVIADRELHDLRFEPDRIIWKKWECTGEQIAQARAQFATSFGSCSFEEPCADLTALGLLPGNSA